MESRTYLKNLRISPKKLRFFLPVIKKKSPSAVLDYLFYSPQKPAKILYQAIKSAINNAKNTLKVSDDLLEWKLLTIEEGQKLKRFKPGGRGTAKPFKIRFSHVKITLSAKEPAGQLQKPAEIKKADQESEQKIKKTGTKEKSVKKIQVSQSKK